MRYKIYSQSPIDLITDKNFNKRELYHIKIHWEAPIPKGGKAYKLWVLAKPHIEYMIYLMGVMSTDELYSIRLAIINNNVPKFFLNIVDQFYNAKRQNAFVLEIHLTEFEIFDYNDHSKFAVPKTPKHEAKKALVVVPEVHPRIPVATANQIRKFLG